MIKSLLDSGKFSISGDFDFEWWRFKGTIPARVFVPSQIYIHATHHIVIFKNQGWHWNIGECLKDFCDIYPLDTNRLIVLTSNCIPQIWDVHYFSGCTNKHFVKICHESITEKNAYELIDGNLLSLKYLALPNKKDDPKLKSSNKKTH